MKCPAFGARVCARIKDVPSSLWAERAHDAVFLGVDTESKWLIGRKDLGAKRPEKRWIIESSSSFVVVPEDPLRAARRGPGGAEDVRSEGQGT